jgi:O-antigen/teichoic acid export membrane protein
MNKTLPTYMKTELGSNALKTTGVMGLRLTAQAGALLLLSRLLGASAFGLFAALASIAVVLGSLASFGTNFTLMRDVASDTEHGRTILPQALGTTIVLGFLIWILYIALIPLLFDLDAKILSAAILIGASETIIQPLLAISANERQARGRIALGQFFIVLPLVLRLLTLIIFSFRIPESPFFSYGIAYILAATAALLLSVTFLAPSWPSPSKWSFLKKQHVRPQAGYSIIGLANRAPGELDKALASQLMPLDATGHYAVASRVLGAVITPVSALTISALPELFRNHATRLGRNQKRTLFTLSLTYGVLSSLLLYLVSPVFISIFGDEYPEIDGYVAAISIAMPGMALRLSGANILISMGYPGLRGIYECIGLLGMALTALIFIPSYPVQGMCWAFALSQYIVAFISWLRIAQKPSETL